MESLTYFLIIISLLNSAISLSREGDHQKCLNQLKIVEKSLRYDPQVEFYKLYSYHRLNQKTNVVKQIEFMENFIPKMPERYMVVTALIKIDVEQWKKDDLGDISRDMLKMKDKLKNGYLDKVNLKDTIKEQKEIVDKLTKLIEENEDKSKKQQQAQAQSNPNDVRKPLDQSQIVPPEHATGQVNQKKFRQLMSNWGSLPPREQAAALQTLTQGLLPRHREAIENYFRLLSEGSRRK